jgi:hypothetical protein
MYNYVIFAIIDGLQSISWHLQDKDMAAMFEESTLQIQ